MQGWKSYRILRGRDHPLCHLNGDYTRMEILQDFEGVGSSETPRREREKSKVKNHYLTGCVSR